MGHGYAAARGEIATDRAAGVALRDVHRIPRHVHGDASLALVRRLARRHDVHDEVSDAAVGGELDLRMPLADARESVDLVARHRVAATRHALDRNGVAAEPRDEPIALGGAGWSTRRERKTGKDEVFHATTFDRRRDAAQDRFR